MARRPVSYSEVKNVCLEIENRGDKVSVRSIRNEIGGGSDGTIAEHLRRYREEQLKNKEEVVLSQLSQNMRSSFFNFIQEAANDLKSIENETIKQMSDELLELRGEFHKLELENERLTVENTQLEKNYQYHLNMSSRNKQDIERLQLELKETREKETQARIECALLHSKLVDRDAEILALKK